MSKLDELKEEVAWLKAIFLALFAADAAIIAWLFNRYHEASSVQLWFALIAVIVISALLLAVHIRAFNKIRKMENL